MTSPTRELQREIAAILPASLSIGRWSFYFLGKAALALTGSLNLDLLFNLTLIAILMAPIKSRTLHFLTRIIVLIFAVILLYHESHLPRFLTLIEQWELVRNFSFSYQVELVFRFIEFRMVATGIIFTIVYWYARRIFNLTTVSIVAIVAASWWSSPAVISFESEAQVERSQRAVDSESHPLTPEQKLAQFYSRERQHRRTPSVSAPSQPLDIIILNICSMSWMDMELSGQLNHPIIQSGSIQLTNFYTGSSYSGPSTLRLLRGHCGHEPHDELFTNSNDCSLGHIFAEQYWQQEILMNHRGDFDNYLELIRTHGGMSQASFQDPSIAPQIMRGFDQMPIYSDAYLLEQWSTSRPAERATFTLYNTISLHDGNQLLGFRGNSMASYQMRAEQLLDDLQLLMDKVIVSNRPTILVIAPEHGAGLQGDRLQIPGMREIPTPALTHVPVTFHLLNMETTQPVHIDAVTGPAAIAHILTETVNQINKSPESVIDLQHITEEVRAQPIVGENAQAIMFEFNREIFIRTRLGNWMRLDR